MSFSKHVLNTRLTGSDSPVFVIALFLMAMAFGGCQHVVYMEDLEVTAYKLNHEYDISPPPAVIYHSKGKDSGFHVTIEKERITWYQQDDMVGRKALPTSDLRYIRYSKRTYGAGIGFASGIVIGNLASIGQRGGIGLFPKKTRALTIFSSLAGATYGGVVGFPIEYRIKNRREPDYSGMHWTRVGGIEPPEGTEAAEEGNGGGW